MNLFVINHLFFGFSAFLISILILLKRDDEIARRWFYFSLIVAIWSFVYAFVADNNVPYEEALFYARVGQAAAGLIPVMWLYFLCGFLNISRRKIFWLEWPLTWGLMITAGTPLFVPSLSPARSYAHMTDPGPMTHVHFVNFLLIVSYGFYLMIREYLRRASAEDRREVLSLFLATVFGFIGGTSQFSLMYLRHKGVDLTLLLSTYPFLMAYAMIKHRVLDIEKIADAFQREKLAAIGVLAAGVNHELKSPLYVAQGTLESYLENLSDKVYQDKDAVEEAKRAMETSLRQLRRASEIMQRLTDFAKPRVGRDHLERVSIKGVLEHVLELVGFQFNLNRIRLCQEVDEELAVLGSRRQLEEIFFNLVFNACQSMEKGGELSIRVKEELGKVRVEVEDQGVGIPRERLARIFEPFYTTKESGTGLGLYITKQLVERNNGSIAVESSLGKGSRFVLKFQLVSSK